LTAGNGRDLGIAGWESMEMGFKVQMGMGMKSLKWEGIGTKNLFQHISNEHVTMEIFAEKKKQPNVYLQYCSCIIQQ